MLWTLCVTLNSIPIKTTYKKNTLKTFHPTTGLLICMTWLISSCYSYRVHVEKVNEGITPQSLVSINSTALQVCIANPSEFPTEYDILRRANIYSITSDSTSQVKVRLKKMYLKSTTSSVKRDMYKPG